MRARRLMRVPALVLAAGSSSRLGRPKQLEFVDPEVQEPERLLERTVRLAREAGCAPVAVVLGASAEQILASCCLGEVEIVFNPAWPTGMASSLQAGLATLKVDVPGTVVLACDQPAVTAAHLVRLVEQGVRTGSVVASAYAGRRGVPAYFPAQQWNSLKQLRGDRGARDLLLACDALDLPGGELDVDTEDTLKAARTMLRDQ